MRRPSRVRRPARVGRPARVLQRRDWAAEGAGKGVLHSAWEGVGAGAVGAVGVVGAPWEETAAAGAVGAVGVVGASWEEMAAAWGTACWVAQHRESPVGSWDP
eukprot:1382669-Amorphochlora_amoeboformis.AAC.2